MKGMPFLLYDLRRRAPEIIEAKVPDFKSRPRQSRQHALKSAVSAGHMMTANESITRDSMPSLSVPADDARSIKRR
ncbi:hypothetical protein D3C87_2101640 [compost metagenome]